MGVKFTVKDDLTVCHLEGEVDINTSPDIKKNFDKVIAKKTPKIVISLSRVTYVDSSGLATLVEILKNMKSYGGKLKLSALSPKVKSLFEITKLDKLFSIAQTDEEATANFL